MSQTTKPLSDKDMTQILQKVYNPTEGVLATGSFLTALSGNKVTVGYPSSAVETYSFYEGSTLLYVLTVTYTSSAKNALDNVERTT